MLNLHVNEAACQLRLENALVCDHSLGVLSQDRRLDHLLFEFEAIDLLFKCASARETYLLGNVVYNRLTEAGLVVQGA